MQSKFNVPENMPPSATDRLVELYKRQKLREEKEKKYNTNNIDIEVQR